MEIVQSYLVNPKDYVVIKKINGGGYGSVYKVQNKATKEILAAKVAAGGSQNRMINREIKIMIHFDHPTIEKLRGYSNIDFYDNKIPTIFMNFEANGSLRNAIEESQKGTALKNYDNTARQIILIGIARGMMILHKNNVIHRDIKPENILLDANLHPLITDFGLSKFFQMGHSMSQSMNLGTCFYMAPEVISSLKFDTKADVFSFGILMYEVISEEHPYPSLKNKSIFQALKLLNDEKLRPKFDKYVKKSFHKLLESCLSTNPNERPTFEDIYLKLAYNFDDFIVDDDEDDENRYFLPDVDKEKVNEYIKEIEEDKSDQKLVKIEENLIKLQADFNESKKENILLRKENQEIKEKYESLVGKFNDFSKDIASIKLDIENLKKEKIAQSQTPEADNILTRLKVVEYDIKKIKESSSSKKEIKSIIKDSSSKSEADLNELICYIPYNKANLYYDHFRIDASLYNDIKKIGSGFFGSIFLSEKDGKKYAIRQIGSESNNPTYYFIKEVEIFIQIRSHPCICKFYGFSVKPPQRMALEYLENGSLKTIFDDLSKNKKVNYWNGTMKSKTVFGIAAALIHLHNQGIFHRNLTPSCILFDSNFEPRITDFGWSQLESDEIKEPSGIYKTNYIYQAPELAKNRGYNHLCDNFSYGIILYHIVISINAFSEDFLYLFLKLKKNEIRPPLPSDISPKLAPMIGDLWKADPNERPELIDIIKSLNDYDEPLFAGTDMDDYKKYRERVIRSTFFTKEQLDYLKQPRRTELDELEFENLIESAEKGNVRDMVKVAYCYEKGIGIDYDLEESINWYRKAAQNNNPEAVYKIANLYNVGCEFFEPDPQKCVEYLNQALDIRYPPAIAKYAYLLLKGDFGVKKDIAKAERIIKMMPNDISNYGEAQYLLAKYYKDKKDIKQYIKYLILACKNDVDDALLDYALMLLKGIDITANLPKGMKILKKVADKGFPMAIYNLGQIYENGLHAQQKDLKKALDYYKVAADKGIVPAIVIVAKALFRGRFDTLDCESDSIQAARLFEYAASKNDPEGLFWWGTFLNNHSDDTNTSMNELNRKYGGTPKNISFALQYYKKAAEAGFVPSMLRLGELYNKGVYGERNEALAKYFYRKGANYGSKEAQDVLMYLEGI